MNLFPPLPTWEGMHPLVVHYPIALFVVAPVPIVIALCWRAHARGLLLAAVVLAALCAGSAVLATATGEASERFVEIWAARPVMNEHERLGEAARNIAIGLAIMLGVGTLAYWRWERRLPGTAWLTMGVAYLLLHGAGTIVLANAAHAGGRLVHEFGIHAPMVTSPAPGAASAEHMD